MNGDILSDNLNTAWVDNRLNLLSQNLGALVPGKWELFDPTPKFYVALESGDDNDLEVGTSELCKHIGLYPCPSVSYEWGLKLPIGAAGIFSRQSTSAHINIPLFYAGRPAALGAILAHELTHAYLFQHPFSEAMGDECEPLTDLTAIYLGLGKAVLNGIHVITRQGSGEGHALGYLGADLTAYSFKKVLDICHIDYKITHKNLNESAIRILNNSPSS